MQDRSMGTGQTTVSRSFCEVSFLYFALLKEHNQYSICFVILFSRFGSTTHSTCLSFASVSSVMHQLELIGISQVRTLLLLSTGSFWIDLLFQAE